jgi:hypothetical protein
MIDQRRRTLVPTAQGLDPVQGTLQQRAKNAASWRSGVQ